MACLLQPCKHGYTKEGEERHSVENEVRTDLFLNVQCPLSQDSVLQYFSDMPKNVG